MKSSNDFNEETIMKRDRKRTACNCKNSNCVKLYCECFRFERFCVDCACLDCMNIEGSRVRENIVTLIKKKKRFAFRQAEPPKDYPDFKLPNNNTNDIQRREPVPKNESTCNCRNSNCQKRYCECYKNKLKCTSMCKCNDCKNVDLKIEVDSLVQNSKEEFDEKDKEMIRLQVLNKLLLIRELKFGNTGPESHVE